MKIFKYTLVALMVTIILNGCTANKELSLAQINSIKTISVHKPILDENLEFYILDSARTSEVQDSVGSSGGFLGSLIGAMIDSGIHSYNQGNFEDKYKNQLDKIKKHQVKNIDKEIELRILSAIKKDSFLNTKIVDKSPTFFDCKITSFGLFKRYLDQNNEAYLGARIDLIVNLKGEDGEPLVYGKYMTIFSEDSLSVTNLSNDHSLVDKLFTQAYDNFENRITLFINEVFKKKKSYTNSEAVASLVN